jgi:uncharacterized membrane protein YphA (DoxX/SURF4 family)
VGEIFIAVALIFGLFTRLASLVLWVIMFFAMVGKKRALPAIELDIVLAVL